METVTPAETERETKPAGDLERGDHVQAVDLHPDAEGIGEVLIAKTFGGVGREAVSILVSYGDRFEPDYCRLPANAPVRIATDAEVAATKDERRRDLMSEQLRDLAALIVDQKLPLPGKYETAHLVFDFGRDIEAVEAVASVLGIGASDSYGTTSVEWPAEQSERGLTMAWQAYTPKKAEPESATLKTDASGMDYTRADSEPDDPTPVSPARVPLHTGGVVDGGQLVDETMPEGRVIGRAPIDEPGPIVGDTAVDQRDNAYAAYERDEAEYLPNCPECMGQHHTIEPCR